MVRGVQSAIVGVRNVPCKARTRWLQTVWSLVENIVEAHGRICVHELSLQAGRKRDLWLLTVHSHVSRLEPGFDHFVVSERVGLSIEVAQHED